MTPYNTAVYQEAEQCQDQRKWLCWNSGSFSCSLCALPTSILLVLTGYSIAAHPADQRNSTIAMFYTFHAFWWLDLTCQWKQPQLFLLLVVGRVSRFASDLLGLKSQPTSHKTQHLVLALCLLSLSCPFKHSSSCQCQGWQDLNYTAWLWLLCIWTQVSWECNQFTPVLVICPVTWWLSRI